MDNSIAFTAIDAVSRSNAYSGSRQQTEGGGVAFTAIDAVSRSNAYSGSRQQTEGRGGGTKINFGQGMAIGVFKRKGGGGKEKCVPTSEKHI